MIGVRHRIKTGDNNFLKHDTGLIGIDTLRSKIMELGPGKKVQLSKYAVREDNNPNRYFKNEYGGLKQYYIGTLDSLGLMTFKDSVMWYTDTKGKLLAEAVDASVNRKLFTEAIQKDFVTVDELDALDVFCPCKLSTSRQEHETLLDLFFDRNSEYKDEGIQRRRTLGLFLDLIKQLPQEEGSEGRFFDQNIFRGCAYTGCLPNGKAWKLSIGSDLVRSGWAIYQRNELLSAAVQCIFWLSLKCIEEERPELHTTEDFANWFKSSDCVLEAIKILGFTDFNIALKTTVSNLPPMADWQNDNHEVALGNQAFKTYKEHKHGNIKSKLLALSAQILLCLMARDDHAQRSYGPVGFPLEYFTLYPVNLESLRQVASTKWRGMTIADWLAWIAAYWGVEAHLRVALRKLRHQSQDTFHILPTDKGLAVAALPDPTYTTPRFSQAIQILQDIGAIDRASNGAWVKITPLGDKLLGGARD